MIQKKHDWYFSRYASWISAFTQDSRTNIRLHEIAWFHIYKNDRIQSPLVERFLFVYILEGKGHAVLKNTSYAFQKGDYLILYMMDGLLVEVDSDELDFISLQFSSALSLELYRNVLEKHDFISQYPRDMFSLFEQIYQLASSSWSERGDAEISSAIYRLLSIAQTQNTMVRRTDAAFYYIEAHYMDNMELETLADLCNMSLYHFIRCFKEDFRLTPHAYLIKYRLRKAEDLLVRTDMPISVIANTVGYQDSSNFSRLFHKEVGILPKEFRNLYRTNHAAEKQQLANVDE